MRAHTGVVHGIPMMAFALDIPCIIEGVETDTHLAAIRGISVQAQGWIWGKPQRAGQVPMLNPLPQRAQPDKTKTPAPPPS